MTTEDADRDLQAVVADAYAAVAQPERFVALMPMLVRTGERHGPIGAGAGQHFENTLRILDKLYPLDKTDFGAIQTQAGSDIDCDLALDGNLNVVAANSRIFDSNCPAIGARVPLELFEPSSQKADCEMLRVLRKGDEPQFIRLYSGGHARSPRWFAARRLTDDADKVIALHAVRLRWDDASGQAFQRALALTQTEIALTQHLVSGGTVREFSEQRDRSIGTVRNQLKALQRKLSIGSKEELLLLYAGFVHSLHPVRESGGDDRASQTNVLNLSGDVRIGWEQWGDPTGLPVVYFHPLEGAMLPKNVRQAATNFGIRIIAPWRPGLGDSTKAPVGPRSPKTHAKRYAEMLDALNIDKFVGLTMQAGAPFMMGMATTYPDRMIAAVGAGAFMPLERPGDFEHLTFQQKLHIRTSRIAPTFAKAYLRAMMASFGTGEFHHFVEDYYDGCERELETVREPEIVSLFRQAARYGLTNGADGMVDTMVNWGHDWSASLAAAQVDIHLLCGSRDASIPLSFVREMCERHNLLPPEVIEGGGSFLLYDEPDPVMRHIRSLFIGDT